MEASVELEDGSEIAVEPEDGSETPAEPADGSEIAVEPEDDLEASVEPEDGSEAAVEPEDGPEAPAETATEAVAVGCLNSDGERVDPYAGCVPDVHPETPELSWALDPSGQTRPPTPEGLPDFSPVGAGTGDLPRPTPELVEWTDDVCLASGTPAYVCSLVLHQSVWALDYLGASQDCIIAEMTAQVELRHATGGRTTISELERGWFLCPSVILPDADTFTYATVPEDGTTFNAEEMAQRCRDVLPADVDLEWGAADCDTWGLAVLSHVGGVWMTVDAAAELLAGEWMQHYHGAPYANEFWVN